MTATAYRDGAALDVRPAPRSLTTLLTLAAVALTIAVSGIVFSEPAPVDALTIGLIVLLPVIGLVAFNPALVAFAALWLLAGAGALIAASFSEDLPATGPHVAVTLYLYAACVVFAAFVAYDPRTHTRLILSAWTVAALIACAAAVFGYFGVIPGGYEMFTEYDRASGTFKDPNVFGPFLIPPFLYLINGALERPLHRMVMPLALATFLALGVFLSFSRGAWINLGLSAAIYGYLLMATTRQSRVRLKLISLLVLGSVFAAIAVLAALSSDQVSSLLAQRASLEQSYDVGAEGRFGGQQKAAGLIAETPLGIGALEFAKRYHPEAAHNVYLTSLLSSGWLGGSMYIILVLATLVFGFRFAVKAGELRPVFLVVYSAFVAIAGEGIIIDSDHWRHFYLLMALIWGMMTARTASPASAPERAATAPPRRGPRILTPPVDVVASWRHPTIVAARA